MTVPESEKPYSNKNGLTRFHIAATGHSLNYLPEYIADRRGFFKEQGLEVTAAVPEPWNRVLDELTDASAAAALGGIWVPSVYGTNTKDYTTFAQLSNRCPLALVKRGGAEGFKLADVVGKTVLVKSGGAASPALFFKMLLRENGLDPASVCVQDLSDSRVTELFQAGTGDYLVADVVSARVIALSNPGVSVAMEMVTDGGGECPWSVYYCETASMTASAVDLQKRFSTALEKGMHWLQQNDAETFRKDLGELFPAAPTDMLVQLTNKYRQNGMWTSTSVSRPGFKRWQQGLTDGGLLKAPFPYEAIVKNSLE